MMILKSAKLKTIAEMKNQHERIKKYSVISVMLITAGCSTPEYRSAANECSYDAFKQYPVNNVSSVVTLTRAVEVPTGRTNCTSTYVYNRVETECKQITRTAYEPYQQTIVIDTNENSRRSTIDSCAARLCYNRYGNADCKSK